MSVGVNDGIAAGRVWVDDDRGLGTYVVEHLDEAIGQGWVQPFYQPVVRTVSGKLCGMEALARWDDPVHGLLPPAVFIPVLEEAQLIHKLDLCVIEQVCRQLRDGLEAGLTMVPVSFNLSRLDFDLCDIGGAIDSFVRACEVPRSFVNIEITESVFGSDPTLMASVLDMFHATGYQVWMDDFGSAYSSLNVLKDFEFDEMKIDMEFLSRFGEKSRTIIASVVDMAKRLGIQTLAEGVETREHAEFLRHIGCEKQQGYLYGRPEPFSAERLERFDRELGIERQDERRYYRVIGSVNTLSLSESDFMPDNTTKDYVTSMPLAFVEYDGDLFTVLDYNDPFAEALESVGIPDVDTSERLMNDTSRPIARAVRRLVDLIEEEGFARHDYMVGSQVCVMRARHVATHGKRVTVLVSIDSAASTQEQRRRSHMAEALETIYSIYEHVDIIHLDEGYAEPVYTQAAFKRVYDIPDLRDAVRAFAGNELYADDRARYLEFMDPETLLERIDATGQGFIVGFFRTRDRGGNFAWKLYAVIRVPDASDNRVLLCIRDTNWENDALFQAAYEPSQDEPARKGFDAADLRISDGSLWRALTRDSQFGVFWKDLDRRFVGCNQRFLDYYGFESADEVIGKTDEEMGWHVDPVPFMNDELRVLEAGESTNNVFGQCIVRGELRDIVASKRPVYRNGRIVGLVGYFIDAEEDLTNAARDRADPLARLLSYGGLDAVTDRFVEAYQRNGTDFAMLLFGVDSFKHYNEQYGYAFADELLRACAEALYRAVDEECVIGHVFADRFVVLKQRVDIEGARRLGRLVIDAFGAVNEVAGTRCTVYAHYSAALYSEAEDIEAVKLLARERLRGTKDAAR